MPLKQQILNSLGLYATRRICRIGSHNCEWVVIESDDLIELLVDGALNNSDKYWKALLRLRGLSHAFHRVVNAKLDALVAELRAKADAARAEFALLTQSSYPKPDWIEHLPAWIEAVDSVRSSDPAKYGAYAAYRVCMETYFGEGVVARLLKYNHTTGFWLHRDELLAWRFGACVKCHGKHGALDRVDAFGNTGRMWMAPCHSGCQTCCPIAEVARDGKAKTVTDMRADAIFYMRPHTQALSELLSTRQLGFNFWVEPIPGIPPELTLLGASGMERADVHCMVVVQEAEAGAAAAAAAALRDSKRTAKRDAEVAKLEAAAEAYLSSKVPSIATLERLQYLESFYGMEHAVPTHPLPSHRKLPLHRVRFADQMAILYKNAELLA